MLPLLGEPERGEGNRHLGGVARVQYKVGVRINQVAASGAGQQRVRDGAVIARSEGVAGVEPLHELALAPGARELAVECVKTFGLCRHNVLVPLDCLPGELGI